MVYILASRTSYLQYLILPFLFLSFLCTAQRRLMGWLDVQCSEAWTGAKVDIAFPVLCSTYNLNRYVSTDMMNELVSHPIALHLDWSYSYIC